MINLHESMGPGRVQTHDPSIRSQTRICCQTRYRLHTIFVVILLPNAIYMYADKYSVQSLLVQM